MIVVAVGGLLVARPALAEIVTFEDIGFLEQTHGPIDGGDTDIGVKRHRAPMQRFDIRVIDRLRQHFGDYTALLGHLHSLVDAPLLDSGNHRSVFSR